MKSRLNGLLITGMFLMLVLAGCGGGNGESGPAGATGSAGATGPAMPVIQSIAVSGVPAARAGLATVMVSAQSAEGLALSYAWSVTAGWSIASGDGTDTVTITAPDTYAASGNATITVTDAQNRKAVGTVALSTEKNSAPDIQSLSAAPNPVKKGGTMTISVAATDPNNDTLTYAWTVPNGYTIQSGQGTSQISVTPTRFGSGSVQVSVSDAGSTVSGSLGVSTYDGAWGTPEPVELGAGNAYNPQIAFDPSGNAIALWSQSTGSWANIFANRYVAGTGWGTAELIETDDAGPAANPQIAFDPNGNAIAVWEQWDGARLNIWANHYVAGTGWGTSGLIETDNAGDASAPRIALDPNGNAIAVWRQFDGTRYNIMANRYVVGTGWGTAGLIETDNAGDASYPGISLQISFDQNGNAIAVWSQFDGTRDSIFANRYVVGTGWGTSVLIETDNTGYAGESQIAFDQNGNAIAVWSQTAPGRVDIWANRYVSGIGWGTAELIETDNTGYAVEPQIAFDPDGNAIAVWSQSNGGLNNIWANRYVAGIGWGTAGLIETDNEPANSPKIALDPNGNALAVWGQSDGTRTNIWANRYVVGTGWGRAELIETDNAGDAWYHQIAVGPNGNAIAVWQQNVGALRNIVANRFE